MKFYEKLYSKKRKKMINNCCGDGKSFKINVKYVPHDSNYSILSKNKDYNKRLFDIISDRKLGFFTAEVQVSNAENEQFLDILGNLKFVNVVQ